VSKCFSQVLARGDTMAPSGLHARLCDAFSSFYLFLMICRRQIISRSAVPIFAIFTSNESFLAVDDRSGPLFRYCKGRCHGNRFCAKMGQNYLPPVLIALSIQNRMEYRYLHGHFNSTNDACILRKKFMKFGPVDRAHL